MKKPLLSIGIIFKNEIRCLERCLKSLQPLRDAVPCEVVMADTGSDDGSRTVAEQYADILFDFPWINDFSAARNAVMDRCSGEWYLSVDADEWLNSDIKELLIVLGEKHEYDYFRVTIHNYKSEDLGMDSPYMDSSATRLARMSTGARFHSAIHENLETNGQPVVLLRNTLFYHDGYVYINPDSRRSKEARNLLLLHKELAERPDDLGLLIQCFESSYEFSEEHMGYLRKGMKLTAQKNGNWRVCGPAIFRYAVAEALRNDLPEFNQWLAEAENLFPDSIMIRLDVNHAALIEWWNRGDYVGCIRRGEGYFQAVKDYETGNFNVQDISGSPLIFASMECQQTARCLLASAYLYEKQPEQCAQTLEEALRHPLNEKQSEEAIRALVRLHALSQVDTVPLVLALWERVNEPVPNSDEAKKRLDELNRIGVGVFRPDFDLEELVVRPAFGLFLPLEDKCDLGRAAAILESCDLGSIGENLNQVENWEELPIVALLHALEFGADFPLPDKPLRLEEMDRLAARLAQHKERFFPLVLDAAERVDMDDWQGLCWARGLVLAAVQAYPWAEQGQDEKQGMALARAFAKTEGAFLPMCYNTECLQEERLFVLPPLHRLGWYCARAFEILEQGGAVEYVRLLRVGLDTCEGMKDMVEFLADHTAEVQQLMAPPELKALADQVRAILARFAPDDPAVAALKQSEAYQKVAYLIEGVEPPVMGGQLQ